MSNFLGSVHLLGVLFPDSTFLNAFESAIVAPLVEE
ncbi:TPA: PrsW family intramembrane metalloprotease, partial [Streptococcus pneumoniae]|nr:PrsW family intramembrane metalloprotease [Streptococcus pneumoniae]